MTSMPLLRVPREREAGLMTYWSEIFPYDALVRFLGLFSDEEEMPPNSDRVPLYKQRFALFSSGMGAEAPHAHFATVSEWRGAMAPPIARIEVGAWIDNGVDGTGKALSSALVFDLDADDYAEVLISEQIPSKETPMNDEAWEHLALSAVLLDMWIRYHILDQREDGDAVRGLGVFSGRRGLHLWYPQVRRDWSNARDTEAIVVALGQLSKPQNASDFRECLENYPPATALLEALRKMARAALHSQSRLWTRLPKTNPMRTFLCNVQRDLAASGIESAELADRVLTAGILIAAPRIDNSVTSSFTHLLKAPFSVHPNTRKISLPFTLGVPIAAFSTVDVSVDDEACAEYVRRALPILEASTC